MPSSSSKNFLKTSFKSMSSSKKGNDNTSIIVILSILLFSIIAGIIIYNSYRNEKFTNSSNKLVYLYMEQCGHCKDFNSTWEEMIKETTKYNITFEKLELNTSETGKKIASDSKINYAPAILLITPSKNYIYDGERTKQEIFKWVSTKV